MALRKRASRSEVSIGGLGGGSAGLGMDLDLESFGFLAEWKESSLSFRFISAMKQLLRHSLSGL